MKKKQHFCSYFCSIFCCRCRDSNPGLTREASISLLKCSSIGRAYVYKMSSKAKKAATIVNYRKTTTPLRSGKVIISQWYRSSHWILLNSWLKTTFKSKIIANSSKNLHILPFYTAINKNWHFFNTS